MFFLTRAAVCIGLVAAAASAAGGGELAGTLDREARGAATRLGESCLASRPCLRLGAGMLAGTLPLAGSPADADATAPPEATLPARPGRRAARPHRGTLPRA